MTKLREQMKRSMELKGYSPRTQAAYLRSVEKYAQHYGKSPALLFTEDIKTYLHWIVTTQQPGSSHVNVVYSALKFLYETLLDRTWDFKKIPRTKAFKKLPVLLSPSELKELFAAATNLKHKAMLVTLYAAGLRVSEVANLKVSDIDSKNMSIRVQQAKGNKDRYTLLSEENLRLLRDYWRLCRPKVWLFPGQHPDKPICTRSVQRAFEKAKQEANIQKDVSVHTLRHCFATHLLESGTSIYHIQQLLGHSSPKTTGIYLHLTRKDVLNIKSPFDLMDGRSS